MNLIELALVGGRAGTNRKCGFPFDLHIFAPIFCFWIYLRKPWNIFFLFYQLRIRSKVRQIWKCGFNLSRLFVSRFLWARLYLAKVRQSHGRRSFVWFPWYAWVIVIILRLFIVEMVLNKLRQFWRLLVLSFLNWLVINTHLRCV
jgi:hypothetical protein